jgi:hypothetical protein
MNKRRVICIVYHMLVEILMYAMKWYDISHVFGVVSVYMENLSKIVKWVLRYFRGRVSPTVVAVI